jgi:phage terminase large subunit GpA-like protein
MPDREVGVVEWIEGNIVLSSSDTNAPGPYRFRRTPYLREVLESLSPSSPVQRVVAQKGVQLGYTIAASSWIGYIICQAPRSILYVLPTVDLAKRASKRKLGPIIEETPALRDRVRPSRERDSGNTTLLKEFPGGALIITGANSGAGLRQASAAVIVFDELDAFPHAIAEEGDPVVLAERASRTFPRRKHLYISTPTIAGRSRIVDLFEQSDRRRFFVPCPHCGHKQVLVWTDPKTGRRGIKWSGEPPKLRVWYECVKCAKEISESHKAAMLEGGEWIPERPELSATFRGYHLSALYSAPGTFSWRDAVEQFLAAQKNQDKLRAFVNQVLGEPWEERGDAPPWEEIYRRREKYQRGVVPASACVITAGADVQRDRIEVEVIAWGAGLESWSVDYVTIPGDTASDAPWRELDRLLSRPWKHATGVDLRIRALAVDSGFESQTVYNWTRRHAPDVVFAMKGSAHLPALVGAPTYVDFTHRGKKAYRAVRLWHVGTGIAKRELYNWLRLKPPLNPEKGEPFPSGFLHFPQYDEEHFKQLTAEQLVAKPKKNGALAFEWVMKHERNERLDARVYGRAAACILGLDRWTPDDWTKALAAVGASAAKKPAAPAGERARPRGEGFFGWRSPRDS